MCEDRHVEQWIVQQYASMAFERPITQLDLAALQRRARAGCNSPALEPALWADFMDWFAKSIRGLKQVC